MNLNRLLNSLMKLMFGKSVLDTLPVGGEAPLPDARIDKGGKQFTIQMIAKRDR